MANRDVCLSDLRRANRARIPHFKNAKGEPAHKMPDGSDWCLGQWSNATLGELGEAANIVKKIERGDITLEEARPKLADELADVLTYLDIYADRAGIDLGDALVPKWNAVAERIGYDGRLIPQNFEDAVEVAKIIQLRLLADAFLKFAPDLAEKLCARFILADNALADFARYLRRQMPAQDLGEVAKIGESNDPN